MTSYAALPHNAAMPATLLTVVETSAFVRKAEKLLTDEEHDDLLLYLSMYYKAGDEIPGTGGVRKLRYAIGGRRKSGGVRGDLLLLRRGKPGACTSPVPEE